MLAEGRDGESQLAALVLVQKLPGGHCELIERMLAVYEAKYPADVGRAREVLAMLIQLDIK